MNTRALFSFIALAFGISWLSAGVQYLAGIEYGSKWSVIFTASTVMTGPMIAAFIVRKWIARGSFFEYGWRLKRSDWRGWLLTPVVFIVFVLLIVTVQAIAGNMLHAPSFGTIDMSHQHIKDELAAIAAANPGVPPTIIPPFLNGWVLLAVSIAGGVFAGVTVNLPFCFGEEFGWRGALTYETRRWGFWKANLFIGMLWGFWHAPLILQGHNYPDHPFTGVLMMMLFCTGLAYVLGYIRIRAKSAVACAAFHGMINGSAGGLILLNKGGDSLFGVAGLSGAIAGLLLIAIIYLLDRKRIQRYEEILSESKLVTSAQ